MEFIEEKTVQNESKKFYKQFLKVRLILGLLMIGLVGYGIF